MSGEAAYVFNKEDKLGDGNSAAVYKIERKDNK